MPVNLPASSLGRARVAGPPPGLDFAVNYRLTLPFPNTADANNAVVSYGTGAGQITYPSVETAPNGSSLTCGWSNIGNFNAQDRDATLDPRLCGNNYAFAGGGNSTFDFSGWPAAGSYTIYCAVGADDVGSGDDYGYSFFDFTNSAPPVLDHSGTSKPGNGWTDANGDFLTTAAWLASNAGAGGGTGIGFTVLSTSDVWRFTIVGSNFTRLAHINIVG